MFILPIGHEDLSVRRLPWVTIGIALVCTVVQVHACAVEVSIEEPLQTVSGEMRELLIGVATECTRKKTCSLESGGAEALLLGLRSRTLGTQAEQDRFAELTGKAEELMRAHPVKRFGLKPSSIGIITLFTSMFTHGGFVHLIGNMLFLYLVGVSIEERWGRWRFLVFYLLGGAAAGLAYCLAHRGSDVPLVGASGAIASVMGAFVILYARTKIRFFYFWWMIIFKTGTFGAPAWLVLPLWFLEQLLSISAETSGQDDVGYSAHAGGFAFGAIVALTIRLTGYDKRFAEQTDVAAGGWAQDPLLVEANALVDKGDVRAATMKLSQLLQKNPNDLDARELALNLALRGTSANLIEKHAIPLLPAWSKSMPSRVLEIYAKIAALAGDRPIDERILQQVLTAAATTRNLDAAQNVTRSLFLRSPKSPLIPHAIWAMADIHAAERRPDLEAKMLERLIRDQAGSAWAERARVRLSRSARPIEIDEE